MMSPRGVGRQLRIWRDHPRSDLQGESCLPLQCNAGPLSKLQLSGATIIEAEHSFIPTQR